LDKEIVWAGTNEQIEGGTSVCIGGTLYGSSTVEMTSDTPMHLPYSKKQPSNFLAMDA
jgi:hypothetical protein